MRFRDSHYAVAAQASRLLPPPTLLIGSKDVEDDGDVDVPAAGSRSALRRNAGRHATAETLCCEVLSRVIAGPVPWQSISGAKTLRNAFWCYLFAT